MWWDVPLLTEEVWEGAVPSPENVLKILLIKCCTFIGFN